MLSITKQYSGISLKELKKQITENNAFNKIELSEIDEIITHLTQIDLLEILQKEVIIGIEGEKIVNGRDFYSVFKTEDNFKILNSCYEIGEIPFSPQIIEDENILLSARIWKIKFIDLKAKKIEVIPANDGKKPIFFGNGNTTHQRIREKMIDIIYSKTEFDFLDQPCCREIETLRKKFSAFNINNIQTDRPLLIKDQHVELFTFTGTKINRTIQLLLNIAGIKNTLNDSSTSFEINASKEDFISKWDLLTASIEDIDNHISTFLKHKPNIIDFSKWGILLPDKYKIQILKDKYFDIDQTRELLSKIKLI